jgi:HK97 family phage major capsid protein
LIVAFDDIVSRAEAGADVPKAVADALVGAIGEQSTALTLGTRVPTRTKDSKVPIVASAPSASWVSGDTGLKQTTAADWTPQSLVAEELAAIVPVPDAVLDDSDFPVWDALQPLLARAAARTIDAAVLFGTDAPASFSASLYEDAIAGGSYIVTDTDDPAKAVLQAAEQVGLDGYSATAAAVRNGWEFGAAAANTGALTNNPAGAQAAYPLLLAGLGIRTSPVYWDTTLADAIVADWSKVLIGVRRDFTVEVFRTGVIQDDQGDIVLNLLQQDVSAVRMTMRVGYLLAKPVTGSAELLPSPAALAVPATPES